MPSAQGQFQQWLDQGYVPYEGFNPTHQYQKDVAAEYGLSGEGGAFRGMRPGGPLAYPERPGSRTGRWDVKDRQDILDYLEFVGKMGVHSEGAISKLGAPDYTSEDIAQFFIRPDEKARFGSAMESFAGNQAQLDALGSSQAALGGRATHSGDPVTQSILANRGGIGDPASREAAQVEAVRNIAQAIEGDPGRLDPINRLLTAAESGLGSGASIGRAVSGTADAVSGGGEEAASTGNPYAMALGLLTMGAATPFTIGGADQASLYGARLSDGTSWLEPAPALASWSSKIPTVDVPQVTASSGINERALSGVYGGGSPGGYVYPGG